MIDSIRRRKVAYSELVILKTLTKPLEEYEVRAPHVEAARQLMNEGWRLTLGDRIGYVITSAPGKLYQKAKPYVKATVNDIGGCQRTHRVCLLLYCYTLYAFRG